MIYLQKMGSYVWPNVFSPPALQGLQPSWSGIFGRILNPQRTVNHPKFGTYKVTKISRAEEQRIAAFEFKKKIAKYPKGSYNEVFFLKDAFIIKNNMATDKSVENKS